ncbi:tail fiber assembly protein [Escherichia coli]|uniref:tail fiber assembly protein n=1 Tax=Escherichia TaxID=561 RepID=UPI000A36F474|nr:tail fiber assembly protein [Escherichia coli]EEW2030111.1 hypothetical protein [Escherichia coli]EFC1229088.1 hypothetical protein [Escherichia coli]EFC1238273.1 hypothetical protein [Escherichia coli]EFC2468453.1 hypothetical protein [Escherichia coli]EFD5305394.1 hypothetical protein [Escherichia coli]
MSEKLKIVYRPLQELSPYAHNARTHSTEQVAQLVESIKQFGWTNPVLIDEKGEIIAGHGRVMAAEMLKMDSVPVIVLSGLTDEQKKAYRLKDAEAEKLFRIREAEETKNSLMQVASEHIAPLQDAVDLEIATEEETSLLEAWKKYRVLLNRVDTSTAPDIEWPTNPVRE